MKRCPQCNRVEADDNLAFCRTDGVALLNVSGSVGGDAATAKFGAAPISSEIATSFLPHTSTTPEINRNTGPTTALPVPQIQATTRDLTKPKRRRFALAVIGVTLVVILGLGYFYLSRSRTTAIESIAVMPFVNENGIADVEYLSDGMTETLISSLSQLPNLNVKPRSSVFRYKGKDTGTQAIAKELNVQAILNGRVVQRGQDLSLFVELIDVALDKVVWSQQYNRKQTDLLTLQTDIARDVSSRLKTKLSGADEAKITKTYTTNPEVYQLYLKGNFYRTKYTEEGYQKGIEYYQKALEIDPSYALVYHEIAEAYHFANDWYLSPKEAMPKAKAAALKALELDDSLAQTHYLLGKIVFWYEWDWRAAEREWKRANELDPTYPANYPVYLAAIGKFDEALQAQESVLRSLPLDLNINMDSAGILLSAGQTDRSIAETRKALELDPNFWWAYQNLGLAYERKKQYPEAIAALEKACSVDNSPSNLGYLGAVYGIAGKDADAKRVLGELKEVSKRRHVSPYNMAVVYAGLNDKDQAFEWLDLAYEARSFGMTQLKVETVVDNLRSDPRFKDLLKRMNLPE
jgi:TolB-like protein